MKKMRFINALLVIVLGVFFGCFGAKNSVRAEDVQMDIVIKTVDQLESSVIESSAEVILGNEYTFSIDTSELWNNQRCQSWDFDLGRYIYEYGEVGTMTWSVDGAAVSIVSQAEDGESLTIKGDSLGEATVTVSYDIEFDSFIRHYTSTSKVTVKEKPVSSESSSVLGYQTSKVVYIGNEYTFSIDTSELEDDTSDTFWNNGYRTETGTMSALTWSVDGTAVSIVSQAEDAMSLTIKGVSTGEATVTVSYTVTFSTVIKQYSQTVTINVSEKSVNEKTSYVLENKSVAKGKTASFSIADVSTTYWYTDETVTPTNVKWSVKGTAFSVVSTDDTGKTYDLKAAKEGSVTLTVTYDMEYSSYIDHYTSEATIYVSNPKLSSKKLGINKYSTTYGTLEITGCNQYSTITCTTSSKKVSAYASSYYSWSSSDSSTRTLSVSASKKGNYTVTVDIDGKTFKVTVNVFSAYFKRNKTHSVDTYMDKKWHEGSTMLVLYKGKTEKLTVKGLASGTKIKWKSSNKKVATVNSKGVVCAKGDGACTITATFSNGGSITYEIGVASKIAVNAVYYAIKHFGSTYSQAKRMQTGYYDCSSYIFRAYRDAGVSLGTSGNWAPTAANLGKWCAEKGYVLYDEGETIDWDKLLPGDLIFETGENNGRYKGIYHVDLYVGNYTTLTVQRTKGGYRLSGSTNFIVARPCATKKKK